MTVSNIRVEELFNSAVKENYALAAFNISSLDSIQAVLWAALKECSPVILQIHKMAEKYVRDQKTYLKIVRLYMESVDVPTILQHDHCSSADEAKQAIDNGFDAVMIDGSMLPFDENVKLTSTVVEYAHKKNVWVEAELGAIPAMEDQYFDGHVSYTDPECVEQFIEESGCDSLAISVGTAHGGVAGEEYLPFSFNRLEQIHKIRPNYPFVLHGAASLPDSLREYVNLYGGKVAPTHICSEKDIAKACKQGIHKINMDVDNWMAYTGALRQFFVDHPDRYFPTEYLEYARAAWENEVRHKIRNVAQSSGKSTLFKR